MRSAADAAPSFIYLPDLAARPTEFTLEGEEARYLARVVRARDGERVTASDGRGLVATLEVLSARPELRLGLRERRTVPPPAETRLLCGAPEGERGDWLVEKLAELGVSELVPVETERVRWPASHRLERWERLTVAAMRQSCSAWKLRVGPALGLAEAVGSLEAAESGARWLADPDGGLVVDRQLPPGPVAGAVGPSSGFSDAERKLLLNNGFTTIRLAGSRLRTETAAVALAAVWAASRPGGAPGAEPVAP